jgi:hypothetical protein
MVSQSVAFGLKSVGVAIATLVQMIDLLLVSPVWVMRCAARKRIRERRHGG